MPSVISAGTTTGTALSLTSDTSGELQIKTNNGSTTALTLTTGGAATFTAGTVSAPAITTAGDTNTGIFFPAADTIAFAEGGAEVARFDSSGNLGIGTNSPSSYGKLVSVTGDNATTFAAVSATNMLRVQGYNSTYVGTVLEAVNLAQNANTPMFINASQTLFGISGTERMRIDSSGNLLVGTTTARGMVTSTNISGFAPALNNGDWSSKAALAVSGNFGGGIGLVDGTSGYSIYCSDFGNDFYIQGATSLSGTVSGGVYLNDRGTSWSSASDENVKDIIEPITNAVEKVSTLRAVIGRYKYEPENKRHPFLIAQDVQAVLPEAVSVMNKGSDNECLGLSYTDTIPLLVAAIQELKAEVDALKAQLENK